MSKKKLVNVNDVDTYYKVIDIVNSNTVKIGDKFRDEYNIPLGDKLIIMDTDSNKSYEIVGEPGLYNIQYDRTYGMHLEETNFLKENFLEEQGQSKELVAKLNKFFSNIQKYKDNNLFPKRGFLLHGPPGCSKSATISEVCSELLKGNETMIINWKTFKFRSNDVFDLLKKLTYPETLKKFIFILEDIGGTEVENVQQRVSDSTLLSILDNIDQIYRIPTAIIATTNFPDSLLENLTDRPSRFDELIQFKRPNNDSRAKFLKFFSKDKVSSDILEKIKDKKYDIFSIAHIKEIFIRAEINEIDIEKSLEEVFKQTKKAQSRFEDIKNKKQVGLNAKDNLDFLDD